MVLCFRIVKPDQKYFNFKVLVMLSTIRVIYTQNYLYTKLSTKHQMKNLLYNKIVL